MRKINIKKEKIAVISLLLVVVVLMLVLLAFKLNIFSGFATFFEDDTNNEEPEEKFVYYSYKQICSKDEDYFEELAGLVGGDFNKRVREIKSKSNYCKTSDVRNITSEELNNMMCECIEKNWRVCQAGFEFKNGYCIRGNSYTNSIKACSFYRCEGNYYVEILKKED